MAVDLSALTERAADGADADADADAPAQHARWATADILVPGVAMAVILLAVLVGPLFTPDSGVIDLVNAKRGPGTSGHLLGTDAYGRDILARILEGGRISLLVGVSSVLICLVAGGLLGMIAGYSGGWVDAVITRVMEMILAFPTLVLAIAIVAFLGPSLTNLTLTVAFSQLPQYTRLGRATTLGVRGRDFVASADLLGASRRHIIGRHILPNVTGPLVVYGLLAVGVAILVEASLSFLGLGVRAPTPSWGGMIAEGRADIKLAPHIVAVPGVTLFVTILSINLLADAVKAKFERNRAEGS